MLQHRLFERQAERLSLEPFDPSKSQRRGFIEMFTTHKHGLGIRQVSMERRTGQSAFREELILAYNSRHEVEQEFLWCPITQKWTEQSSCKAAHLFPYALGQAQMDTIFDREDPNEPE